MALFDRRRQDEIHKGLEKGNAGAFARKSPATGIDEDRTRTQPSPLDTAEAVGPSAAQNHWEEFNDLVSAIKRGDLAGVKSALRKGADINRTYETSEPPHMNLTLEYRPLDLAEKYGHADIADFLKRAGGRRQYGD